MSRSCPTTNTTCSTYTPAKCILYSGSALCTGIVNGDSIDVALQKISDFICGHEPIQFIVGSGEDNVPADQDTDYNNSDLEGKTNFLPFDEGSARFLQRGRDFYYKSTGGFGLLNDLKFYQDTGWTLIFY